MRTAGTVKWFSESRGFGLITPEDGQQDCVVRHSAIQGQSFNVLVAGDRAEFDVVQGHAGPTAENVIRVGRKVA